MFTFRTLRSIFSLQHGTQHHRLIRLWPQARMSRLTAFKPQALPKIRWIHFSNPSNATIDSVLVRPAARGHVEAVEQILPTMDVNQPGLDGTTALSSAAQEGHANVVMLLLQNGADPNLDPSQNGSSPLLAAARAGHVRIVSALLEHGANPNNATNHSGLTPLIIAASAGHLHVVQTLLHYGASINQATSDNGATALFEAAREGHANVVRVLLDHGADINKANSDNNCTPLCVACEMGHIDVVRELLLSKPDLQIVRSTDAATPLTIACTRGHVEIARMLLQAGANPNFRWREERGFSTPLIATMMEGNSRKAEIVKLLVEYRANVEETVATAKQWDVDPDLLALQIVSLLRTN